MKRKEFLKIAASGAIGVSSLGYLSCEKEKEIFFKLSLAQWSFHRAIHNGIMSPYTFAQNAKTLGFDGIEYVNALYDDVMKVENKSDFKREGLNLKLKKTISLKESLTGFKFDIKHINGKVIQ